MCSEVVYLKAFAAEDIIDSYPAPTSILPLLEKKMKVRNQTETGYYRLSQITLDQFCLATALGIRVGIGIMHLSARKYVVLMSKLQI